MSENSNKVTRREMTEYELFLQKLSEAEKAEFHQRLKEMVEHEEEIGIHYSPSPGIRLMMSWERKIKLGKIKI